MGLWFRLGSGGITEKKTRIFLGDATPGQEALSRVCSANHKLMSTNRPSIRYAKAGANNRLRAIEKASNQAYNNPLFSVDCDTIRNASNRAHIQSNRAAVSAGPTAARVILNASSCAKHQPRRISLVLGNRLRCANQTAYHPFARSYRRWRHVHGRSGLSLH